MYSALLPIGTGYRQAWGARDRVGYRRQVGARRRQEVMSCVGRLRIRVVGHAVVRVRFYTYAYTGYNKNRFIDRQGCVKGV